MAKKTSQEVVASLNHASGKMPEAVEYVIGLFTPAISMLAENSVTKQDLVSSINSIVSVMDQKVNKTELAQIAQICGDQQAQYDSLLNAVNSLANSVSTLVIVVDKLKSGTIDMASHVDGDATPEHSYIDLNPDNL